MIHTPLALAICLGLGLAGAAAAQNERRELDAAEAQGYAAVGRLDVATERFCTATLVSDRLVLTAAHCLVQPETGVPIPVGELLFAPGPRPVRDGGYRVKRMAIPPDFKLLEAPRAEELRADIALLELEAPLDPAEAAAFATGPLLQADAPPRIVSYAHDRSRALAVNAACPPLGMIAEVLVIACPIEHGVSGAPVFAGEGAQTRVVAVVSSMGQMPGGEQFALAVAVAPWMDALMRQLAEPAPEIWEEE